MSSWRFPTDVRGWLTESEGRKLAELASSKTVLEIGSFEGLSTICMAQTAAVVHCIDPMDGRSTEWHFDTEALFRSNLLAHDVRHKVWLHRGTTAEIAPRLEPGFDFIFIDGDHSLEMVKDDIRHALKLLAPGGLLAFHDYHSQKDPDVAVAVNELLLGDARLVETCDSLAVVQPVSKKKANKPVVALAMPRRGNNVAFGASEAYHLAPTIGDRAVVVRLWTSHSILDHCFNRLWSCALNLRDRGITHFAMIHDDNCPQQGFLNILLDEMDWYGADIVSAVVAIKSEQGLSSTAVETDDPWYPRRLTMHEVHSLPSTFTDKDVGGELLLNTGLWVANLTKPWADQPEPLFFQTLSRIIKDKNGEWQAQVRSEDWEFSRAARARGAKLYATRKVAVRHAGEIEYTNDHVWGTWQTDEVHAARLLSLKENV